MAVRFAIIMILAFSARGIADTGLQAWAQRYEALGSGGNAIAADDNGSAIVVGGAWQDGISYDFIAIKYSASGVPLWTNYYRGPDDKEAEAQSVAAGTDGTVVVAGRSFGDASNPFVEFTVISYSSQGRPGWTNYYRYDGDSSSHGCMVGLDGSGDVILAGYSTGNINTRGFTTIKYSGSGMALWTNRYAGPGGGDDYCRALTIDSVGSVIVTGESYGGASSYDYATVKYSSAGLPLWTNRYSYPGNYGDRGSAATVDAQDNVFVTGYSSSGVSEDFLTIKYASDGVPLWTNRFDGPEHYDDRAQAITVDGNGDVIVTGYAYNDYLTIKYSNNGLPLWTNRYGGQTNGYDEATSVAVDGARSVYVVGFSWNGNSFDYTTIKYSSGGLPLWTNRYNGLGNGDNKPQRKSCLAVRPDSDVYVTGISQNAFATVKYISRTVIDPLVGVGAANLVVRWTTVPNQSYQLQYSTNLNLPNWLVVTNIMATGGNISVVDTRLFINAQLFYRVLLP